MRAIVVGGGIGGLAAGVALTRAGWDVAVLEQATGPPEIGAGISLWPNALAALEHLDVWPDIRASASMQVGGARRPDGRWLTRADPDEPPLFELLLVHRADLHAALQAAFQGDLRFGTTVTEVDPSGAVTGQAASGPVREQADLVVAADGLHSRIRTTVEPGHPGPVYAGYTAWRGVTSEPFALEAAAETWGPGGEFGATIMVDGRVYWFATANRPEGQRVDDEHGEVLRMFGDWHAPLRQIVDATEPAAVLRHDVYSLRTPLPRFVHGRVALLGDAAHAMTPNLGQGGCQALEDAVTLAALVRTGDVRGGLDAYDAARRMRTQRLVNGSMRAARLMQTDSRVLRALRDTAARVLPQRLAAAPAKRMAAWRPPSTPPPAADRPDPDAS